MSQQINGSCGDILTGTDNMKQGRCRDFFIGIGKDRFVQMQGKWNSINNIGIYFLAEMNLSLTVYQLVEENVQAKGQSQKPDRSKRKELPMQEGGHEAIVDDGVRFMVRLLQPEPFKSSKR